MVRCNAISGLIIANLTCSFSKNSLGSALLPAGTNKPIVHVAQIGYVDSTTVNSISVGLAVKSISPTSTGQNGGISGTLLGTGFPMDNSVPFVLKICGNNVKKVTSVSN